MFSAGVGQLFTASDIEGEEYTFEGCAHRCKKANRIQFLLQCRALSDAKPVTLDVKNASLAEVLKATFSGQTLQYVVENKTVFISRSAVPPASGNKQVQELLVFDPVKIRVTDAQGQPLSGATVTSKKSKKSGVTDAQGNITLNLDAGDEVTISYVGYTTQELKISEDKKSLLVALQTKTNTNDEVVVMAYGQKKGKQNWWAQLSRSIPIG